MLRTFSPLRERIKALTTHGFEAWQLEQAVINQRIWSQSRTAARGDIQRPKEILDVISRFLELDRPNWHEVVADEDAILKQAQRDLRFLLKGLGGRRPDTTAGCQRELARQGYLRAGGKS